MKWLHQGHTRSNKCVKMILKLWSSWYNLRNGNLKIRNHLHNWIKEKSCFSAGKLGSTKKLKLKCLEKVSPVFRDYSETRVHQDIAKSLLEFGLCKSWVWIFHRLLEGTWSKNSSNSPGSTRLYKAMKNKECKPEGARGAQSLHPARAIFHFEFFFSEMDM